MAIGVRNGHPKASHHGYDIAHPEPGSPRRPASPTGRAGEAAPVCGRSQSMRRAAILSGGEIVAKGFHLEYGGPHAEIQALKAAKDSGVRKKIGTPCS